MRILHTADWHLGDRLGRIDRTDDLRRAVERVAAHFKNERVDVLLVAGDLFSELARPDGLRETIRHWQDVFREFLETGGTILTLTGNHDNENFCQTLVHAMSLAAPTVGKMGQEIPPGRLYLAADPTFVKLQGVQFVLMPYPTPSHFFKDERSLKYGSPDEKNRLLVTAWADALRDIRAHPNYDLHAPAVLSAHIQLYGAEIGPSLFRMTPEQDMVVEGSELPSQFDYVALGHVHKPQMLGSTHVRYCGSIEKMDLGEAADMKGVVLVEIGSEGLSGEPVVLPMPSTAICEETIRNPAEDLPRLKREYADAPETLVNLHINYTSGVDNLEDVLRELDRIFPRWYARDWKETSALGPSLALIDGARNKGFGETVRDYLGQELIHHTEADRAAILNLAEELLKEFEG